MIRIMRFAFILFALLFAASSASAADFQSWLTGYKQRAVEAGVSKDKVDRALAGVRFDQKVIDLDRKQPEGQMTLATYVEKTVTPKRVEKGRKNLAQYRSMLQAVERDYGVPPQIIMALWGKETDFGGFTGKSETISSLATLAFEGRRWKFFEQELLNAIVLMDYLKLSPSEMRGSWAGAVGQCQFMPSNYLKVGVDGNRNGRVDLWNEMPDVFASMANLLKHEGWARGASWGQKINLPTGFDKSLIGRDKVGKDHRFWEQRGVRFNSTVPSSVASNIRIYQPDGVDGPAYAIYPNFDVLMRWNRSGYFAVAVGRLSDKINSLD